MNAAGHRSSELYEMRLDVRNSAGVASDGHDLATGDAIPIGP